jgi:hypothetical protein
MDKKLSDERETEIRAIARTMADEVIKNPGVEIILSGLTAIAEYKNGNYLFSMMLKIGQLIHYPDCWDTVAYPTLYDAIAEILMPTKCPTCRNEMGA